MKRSIELVVLSLMLLGVACIGKHATPKTLNPPSPSPQGYVSVVCNAVLEWKNSIEVRSSSIVTEAASLEAATAYLKGVLDVTDQMLVQVQAVGAPTVSDGPNPHSDVIHSLVAARSAILRLQANVASVAQDSVDLLKEVELPIISTVEAIKSELRNPSSIEIDRATASDTDCHRLFSRRTPVGSGA